MKAAKGQSLSDVQRSDPGQGCGSKVTDEYSSVKAKCHFHGVLLTEDQVTRSLIQIKYRSYQGGKVMCFGV